MSERVRERDGEREEGREKWNQKEREGERMGRKKGRERGGRNGIRARKGGKERDSIKSFGTSHVLLTLYIINDPRREEESHGTAKVEVHLCVPKVHVK